MMTYTFEMLDDFLVKSERPYDREKIKRAYLLAEQAHTGQKRVSGEPYISHPIAVAYILGGARNGFRHADSSIAA